MQHGSRLSPADAATAREFVRARQGGVALPVYPGERPQTLDAAYAIQDAAIDLWAEPVAGWKVGRINGDDVVRHGTDRLVGPIFAPSVKMAGDGVADMAVFTGGFGAVEGECIIVMGEDAPAGKTHWTVAEALELVSHISVGVEIASSPYAGINADGPLVTISDFGNNHGLLIGEVIADWRELALPHWRFETIVNGASVGARTPDSIPGGPLESLRYLLENTARRGRPLKAGMAVSSGAVTGVHQVGIGDTSEVRGAGAAPIRCRIVAARPQAATPPGV